MPNNQQELSDRETVLWEGKPRFGSRRVFISLIGTALIFAGIEYYAYFGEQKLQSLSIFPLILFGLNLYLANKYLGTRYYVTNRRAIREQRFLALKRHNELPLDKVAAVNVDHHNGRDYITFVPERGSPIIFDGVRDDPEMVKQIALNARLQFVHRVDETTS